MAYLQINFFRGGGELGYTIFTILLPVPKQKMST